MHISLKIHNSPWMLINFLIFYFLFLGVSYHLSTTFNTFPNDNFLYLSTTTTTPKSIYRLWNKKLNIDIKFKKISFNSETII